MFDAGPADWVLVAGVAERHPRQRRRRSGRHCAHRSDRGGSRNDRSAVVLDARGLQHHRGQSAPERRRSQCRRGRLVRRRRGRATRDRQSARGVHGTDRSLDGGRDGAGRDQSPGARERQERPAPIGTDRGTAHAVGAAARVPRPATGVAAARRRDLRDPRHVHGALGDRRDDDRVGVRTQPHDRAGAGFGDRLLPADGGPLQRGARARAPRRAGPLAHRANGRANRAVQRRHRGCVTDRAAGLPRAVPAIVRLRRSRRGAGRLRRLGRGVAGPAGLARRSDRRQRLGPGRELLGASGSAGHPPSRDVDTGRCDDPRVRRAPVPAVRRRPDRRSGAAPVELGPRSPPTSSGTTSRSGTSTASE